MDTSGWNTPPTWSSSALRGFATRSPWPLVGMSGTSPHQPYEGSQRDVAPVGDREVLASSSALRGFATYSCRPRPLRRFASPHQPYEGSQHADLASQGLWDWCRPHQPYEGSQRGCVPVRRAHEQPVLISPTRVRNTTRRSSPAKTCSCPHQPYEGSQHGLGGYAEDFGQASSSALRGFATQRHGARLAGRCPHQPYEGSQRFVPGVMVPMIWSSSALRGFATGSGSVCRVRTHTVLISPTRVRNAYSTTTSRRVSNSGPHQPYEGSQHPERNRALIAERRPHQPYEGSQHKCHCRRCAYGARPHQPYEGSQRRAAVGR